jgi:AmiR/NasT family two-component response regulator
MIWSGVVIVQGEAGVMMRVFIVSSHPLFGQGVESLLRQEAGVEIVGREADVDEAVERIKELRPDVVILDSADLVSDPTPAVMRILREGVRAKVIGLNLEDNTMCVYRGEQREVKGVEDLVEAIEPSLPLPESLISEDLVRPGQVAEPRKTKGGQNSREYDT